MGPYYFGFSSCVAIALLGLLPSPIQAAPPLTPEASSKEAKPSPPDLDPITHLTPNTQPPVPSSEPSSPHFPPTPHPAPNTQHPTPLFSTSPPELAQVDPGQDRLPQEPPSPVVPLPEEEEPSPPTIPTEPLPPGADTPFAITDIQVVGSTVFDPATLAAIVAPYENQEVTLAELQQAADAITQLYLNEGYITSRAIVGTQTIVDGVVQIDVLEGELEEIVVEGTDTLQDYVRVRVAQGGTRPLNQANLEDKLRLLRIDPLFEGIEASLRAGSGVGKSRLIVRVEEASTMGGSVFSDNYSQPSVGDVRVGGSLQFRNLAGLGDILFGSATWTTTAGSKVYELGYRVPISPMNGTLTARMTPNNFEITDPEQLELAPTDNIRGSTDIYEVIVRQPLVRTPRDEFALSLGYRYRDGETLISGTVSDASTTHVLSFGQDYVHRDRNGAWGIQSQFRLGEEQQGDTIFGDGDTNTFFSWLGQIQRVQRLGSDHQLLIQASAQLTPDSLPGSEQFFAGGGLSVRGYDQNQRFGDNGLRFSIEDQIVITRSENNLPLFQIAPFIDGAYVWNNSDTIDTTDNDFLLGTGIGFLLNATEALNARVDLAYPLVDIQELGSDDPPGLRFYFSIGYRF